MRILRMMCSRQLYLHLVAGHLRDKFCFITLLEHSSLAHPQNLMRTHVTWTAEPYRVKTRTRHRI